MTHRIVITALLAATLAGGLAGAARAQEEAPTPEELVSSEAVAEGVSRLCGGGGGDSPPTLLSRSLRAAASAEECAQPYFCRTARVARVHRSLLGFVLFKFWHWKRWCWRYPRILSVQSGTYVTDVDSAIYPREELPPIDYRFVWCCGRSDSGHFSRRQRHFENCVVRYGCFSNFYPWVLIRAHGDGSYSWRTGI